MARPGIMVYFDMMGPLSKLPDEDKGRLFWAMLEYGKFGTVPQFDGLALELAWEFVKPKLDKDEEAYGESVLQRQYAAFCKKRQRLMLPKVPFEEWVCMSDNERQRAVDPVASRKPSTSTTTAAVTTTPTVTETTTAAAAVTTTPTAENAATAADADSQLKMWGGKLGQGVVALTDNQAAILLEKMGQEVFDHYVTKLSSFIIRNGAQVKSHYATILKWWMEDSETGGED